MFRRILAGAAIAAAALGFSATAASADIGPSETSGLAAISIPLHVVNDALNNAFSQAEVLSRFGNIGSLTFNLPVLNQSNLLPLFSTIAVPQS